MALNDTPKSSTADAYLTEAEATAYLDEFRLFDSAWVAASVEDRESAIRWATALLDQSFEWRGVKRTIEQSLRFPRSGLLNADGENVDQDTIPVLVERATAELALYLIQSDPTKLPGVLAKGLRSVQLGPIAIEADAIQRPDLIPQHIVSMLEPLGHLKAGAVVTGTRVVPLMRA